MPTVKVIKVKRDRNICFEPLEDFSWFKEDGLGQRALVAQYQVGLEYNCSIKPVHDDLADMLKTWIDEKKIITKLSTRKIRVVAKGTVSEGSK